MNVRSLLVAIAVIIVCIYVYSYYLNPGSVSVLQTSALYFSPNMLLEKQPVVVEDGGKDFFGTVTKQWSFTKHVPTSAVGVWYKNKFKHVAFSARVPTELLVCPATVKRDIEGIPVNEAAIIAFKMQQGQTVFIPFHWSYYIPASPQDIDSVGIHDIVTYFLP